MTETATTGLRRQCHIDSLYSASTHFAADKKQKATVSTGITIEYVVHARDIAGATEEERVVLIMGFRQAQEAWAATVDQLLSTWAGTTKSLRILTFDNRGIGGTDAPWWRYTTSGMAEDTMALMDHLGWTQAHIVGISMGGMISLELAATVPTRVQSLSLLVTTRGKFVNERGNEDMRTSILSNDPDVIVKSVLKMLYPDAFLDHKMQDKDSTLREELYKYHQFRMTQTKKPHLHGVVNQVLAIRTHFVSDERLAAMGKAGFPVLVIGGRLDALIPGSESEKITEFMAAPHVKLIVYEDGGHGLFIQYLDEVTLELFGNFQRASL